MNPEQLLHTALHGDPIDAIPAIHELREILEQAERHHVLTLRRHGASWAFIAQQLDISRQAAHRASDDQPSMAGDADTDLPGPRRWPAWTSKRCDGGRRTTVAETVGM